MTRNTIKTKIKEQYLAVRYEKLLTEQYNGSKEEAKKYILELYLNTINLGHGYNGIKVAAEGYFGKEPMELTLAECASLAGITNNPSLYSPRSNPEENKKRQTTILNYMLAQGLITQDEYNQAVEEDVISHVKASSTVNDDGTTSDTVIHSYYEDALIDQISEDLQTKYNMTSKQASKIIYDGGLQIYANVDEKIQDIVDAEFQDDDNFPWVTYCYDATYTVTIENTDTNEQTNSEYQEFTRSKESAEEWVAEKKAEIQSGLASNQKIAAERATYSPQPQASMAIIDYHTGEIKAIGGGRGEKIVNRAFNRATDSARQPGSVFKPLAAYAPAIDLGKITPATVIVDEPYTTADGYTPKNWWGNSYRGGVTPRVGLRDSMNVVAVKIMVTTGIDLCYDYLLNFGFTTLENDNHASTALGGITNGVTQVEVAAAYGTLANNGEYLRPMFYSKVLDHDGNILLENTQEPTQVVKSSTAYIMTDLMTSVITEGTGTTARFRNSSMPISGKTGTTTDSKDLTFVGYTPYYVASIWLGYDRYDDKVTSMNNVDQSAHLRIWREVMEEIHEDLEVVDFPIPDTVEKATVCKYSGKQASSYCPSVTDYFEKGTPATDEWCDGSHSGYTAYGGGNIYSYSGSSSNYSSSSGSSSRRRRYYYQSDDSSGSDEDTASDDSGEAEDVGGEDTDSSGGDSSDSGAASSEGEQTPAAEQAPAEAPAESE